MVKQDTNSVQGEHSALLYGMQRTGSNYVQQVLLQNFKDIRFYNNDFARCLPTHKHFRLYDEKYIIPDVRFYNSFTYESFKDFKKHAEELAGREIKLFVVCIKDPYSWYVSYKKHAKKNKYVFIRNSVNSHYIIDYNLFYRKWFEFSKEAPDEVLLIKYEDFLEDLEASLQKVGEKIKLERFAETVVNPGKVPMSRNFTSDRAAYYKNNKYLNLITDREKAVIPHLLDQELLSALNYQIVK